VHAGDPFQKFRFAGRVASTVFPACIPWLRTRRHAPAPWVCSPQTDQGAGKRSPQFSAPPARTSSGIISVTTSAAGTYSFTIQVTDSGGNTGSQAFSITISDPVAGGGAFTF